MDKDRVVGSTKQVKGAVEQAVGKAVGDAKLESEGKADRIEERFRTQSAASKTRSAGSRGNFFPCKRASTPKTFWRLCMAAQILNVDILLV